MTPTTTDRDWWATDDGDLLAYLDARPDEGVVMPDEAAALAEARRRWPHATGLRVEPAREPCVHEEG